MAKRCGYCREYNHQKPKCPTILSEIETIRKYIPLELWRVHNALVEHGFGLGAMVEVGDWDGQKRVCIIDSLRNITAGGSYPDFRNVKYSKQVRTRLKNFSGQFLPDGMPIPNNVSFDRRQELSFQCLDPSNPSRRISATVTADLIGFGAKPLYMWTTPAVLLSPSHETDMTYRDFLDVSIHLNERLQIGDNERYVTGLAV